MLAGNPDMPVSQCIKESCRIMAGNKGRYFYLQLTFIGWYILANIPSGIFSSLIDGNGAFAIVMTILLSLPVVVVDAYMMVSVTAFYELATERLVVMSSTDYDNMVNAEYTVKEDNASAVNPEAEPEKPAEAAPDEQEQAPEERQE